MHKYKIYIDKITRLHRLTVENTRATTMEILNKIEVNNVGIK